MKTSVDAQNKNWIEEWKPSLRNREETTEHMLTIFKRNDTLREIASEDKLSVLVALQQFGSGKTTFGMNLLHFIRKCFPDSIYAKAWIHYFSANSYAPGTVSGNLMNKLDTCEKADDGPNIFVIDEIGNVFGDTIPDMKELWHYIDSMLSRENTQFLFLGRGAPLFSDMELQISPFTLVNLMLNNLKQPHIESILKEDLNLDLNPIVSHKIYEYTAGIPLIVRYFCALIKQYSEEGYGIDAVLCYSKARILEQGRVRHIIRFKSDYEDVKILELLYMLVMLDGAHLPGQMILDRYYFGKHLRLIEVVSYLGFVYDMVGENSIKLCIPKIYLGPQFIDTFGAPLLKHHLLASSLFSKGKLLEFLTRSVLRKGLGMMNLDGTKKLKEIMPWAPSELHPITLGKSMLKIMSILGVSGNDRSAKHDLIREILGSEKFSTDGFPTNYEELGEYSKEATEEYLLVKSIPKEAGLRYFIMSLFHIKSTAILLPLSETNVAFDEAVYFAEAGVLWLIQDKYRSDASNYKSVAVENYLNFYEQLKPFIGKECTSNSMLDDDQSHSFEGKKSDSDTPSRVSKRRRVKKTKRLRKLTTKVVLKSVVFSCINTREYTGIENLGVDDMSVYFTDANEAAATNSKPLLNITSKERDVPTGSFIFNVPVTNILQVPEVLCKYYTIEEYNKLNPVERAEAERKAQEEAERKAQEEAERKAQAQAELFDLYDKEASETNEKKKIFFTKRIAKLESLFTFFET